MLCSLPLHISPPCHQVFTQITLVLLLWGTMCGGLALISDVAVIMVDKGWAQGQPVPPWINGRTCMAAVAVLVLFPLCLQRHMREVGAWEEAAAAAPVTSPLQGLPTTNISAYTFALEEGKRVVATL
jgi:hypothetical protein